MEKGYLARQAAAHVDKQGELRLTRSGVAKTALVIAFLVLVLLYWQGLTRVYRVDGAPPPQASLSDGKAGAVTAVRDAYAHRLYGKPYSELDQDHRTAVDYAIAYDSSR